MCICASTSSTDKIDVHCDCLLYTSGRESWLDNDIIDAYMKMMLLLFPYVAYLPMVQYEKPKATVKRIKALFVGKIRIVVHIYRSQDHFRLLVVYKDEVYHYDSKGGAIPHWMIKVIELLDLKCIPGSYPEQEPNDKDNCGIYVILKALSLVRERFEWTQDQAKLDVEAFREKAQKELYKHYPLFVNGKEYNPHQRARAVESYKETYLSKKAEKDAKEARCQKRPAESSPENKEPARKKSGKASLSSRSPSTSEREEPSMAVKVSKKNGEVLTNAARSGLVKTLNSEKKKLEEKISELEGQKKEVEDERNELKKCVTDQKNDLENLDAEVQKKDETIRNLRAEMVEKDQEIGELKNQNAAKDEKMAMLEKENSEAVGPCNWKCSVMEDREYQFEAMNAALEKETALRQKVERERDELAGDLANRIKEEKDVKKAQQLENKRLADYERKLEAWQKRQEAAAAIQERQWAVINEGLAEVTNGHSEVDADRRKVEADKREVARKRQALIEREWRVERREMAVDGLEDLTHQLSRMRASNRQVRSDLKDETARCRKIRRKLIKLRREWNEAIDENAEHDRKMDENFERIKKQRDNALEQNEMLQKTIEELQRKLERLNLVNARPCSEDLPDFRSSQNLQNRKKNAEEDDDVIVVEQAFHLPRLPRPSHRLPSPVFCLPVSQFHA